MKATVVHGAALSSSHFIWPPLRQVNRLYSPDGHILAGGNSGRVRFIFIYFISLLIFFSTSRLVSVGQSCLLPPRFLHALTPFDKLAPFEGYRLFPSARTTTGFSLHLHCCELKRDFCPVFGKFSSLFFFFFFAAKASVGVSRCLERCQSMILGMQRLLLYSHPILSWHQEMHLDIFSEPETTVQFLLSIFSYWRKHKILLVNMDTENVWDQPKKTVSVKFSADHLGIN